jgi:hypothetical protein
MTRLVPFMVAKTLVMLALVSAQVTCWPGDHGVTVAMAFSMVGVAVCGVSAAVDRYVLTLHEMVSWVLCGVLATRLPAGLVSEVAHGSGFVQVALLYQPLTVLGSLVGLVTILFSEAAPGGRVIPQSKTPDGMLR